MLLATREIARSEVRFGLLAGAVGLLVFLILFQQALFGGLAAVVGALVSLRRIVRIDPASAIGAGADPGSPMPTPALQLTDVRKTYRSGDQEVVALDDASLEVIDGRLKA